MQSFISELGKFLENSFNNKIQMPIIEDILSKNNLTTGNENAIRDNINDIILEYAEKNFKSETMYFVQDSKKTYWKNNERQYDNSVYSVLKVENNQIEQIEIDKKNMPKDVLDKATEGAVLKYTNGTYEYYSNDGFERLDKIN